MSKKLTLLLSDIVALYGALALVIAVRYGPSTWHAQWQIHLIPFTVLFVAWVFSFYIANLYEPRILRNNSAFLNRFLQASGVAALLSLLFFYFIPLFGIAPKVNLFLFLAFFGMLGLALRALANRLFANGAKRRVLILGVNTESVQLAQAISENPQLGYRVRALAQATPIATYTATEQLPAGVDIIGNSVNLVSFVQEKNIDIVVVSPEAYQSPQLMPLFEKVVYHRVEFMRLADFTEEITGTVPLGAISDQWFIDTMGSPKSNTSIATKRALDLVGAAALSIPTLAITPFVALGIKLSSPGPILYSHLRSGRNGTPFRIYKFRSMKQDAEATTGAVWASEGDPRITSFGRFLRLTRIDELPQLWNIIRGDISFVGPRAERPELDAQLAQEIPFYLERYLVRPGLSGWAQINYPYGASVEDSRRKLEYDLYYMKHQSLALDLEIILKTISTALRFAGR